MECCTLLFFINLPFKDISCLWSSICPAKRLWMRSVMDHFRWELHRAGWGHHRLLTFSSWIPRILSIKFDHATPQRCLNMRLHSPAVCVCVCSVSIYGDMSEMVHGGHLCPHVDRKTELWSVSMWTFSSTNEDSSNPLAVQHEYLFLMTYYCHHSWAAAPLDAVTMETAEKSFFFCV